MSLPFSNLLNILLRCGTRLYEWDTQWDSNSLVKIPEAPKSLSFLANYYCFEYFYSRTACSINIIKIEFKEKNM